ncbi:NADH-ubiquinone oxidoreductase chain J [Serinicoccus hydrothermalis]|uniref:NADH-quinone oxidoreductase subunit J n=1 Tax=Serinicoccus hydrothermalis TaxID=1758689 RepID=A0A1B1NFK1_9MICO|nr:NADH-quinone oxidoreductase subunit J [Serinicoccus hydrothermalis]ANS80224.1 NADH-ubiquinone oxidoreductase chain J [Serinicoccus hydrothermalis]
MSGLDVLFSAVGLVTLGAALLSVTSRVVLHAALWLVVTLGGLAGCYLVLGAELVALVQLLIYVGAVVVLVLFALMLTRSGGVPVVTSVPQRVAAGLVGAGTTVVLGGALLSAFGWGSVPLDGPGNEAVAATIFGTDVWPFELLSVLLLTALVAAVAVARAPVGGQDAPSQRPDAPPEVEAVQGEDT